MLENRFTTKMSMDKKSLQQRFWKIRSKSGRASRLTAVIIFLLVLIIIAVSAMYVAVKKSNEFEMSGQDYLAFISRPIGAIMAEIDYADNEKIVFHYGNGFFITDEKTKEVKHKIDLSKLNCALPVQADTILDIKIDSKGRFAYLTNVGVTSETEKLDNYIINLNSGAVKKGEMPENTELFTGYGDTSTINIHGGWPSNRYVLCSNKAYYLLYRQYEVIGNIQLVTIDYNNNEKTELRYIFGNDNISVAAKETDIIHNALADGEIITGGGRHWVVDGYDVRLIINEISSIINMKTLDVKDGSYKIMEYATELNGSGAPRLFIINTDTMELLFSYRFDESAKKSYSNIEAILNEKGVYMSNAENLTYNTILSIQAEADNGHYPWRLDPIQTAKSFFEMNELMAGGDVSNFAGDDFKCAGTISKNGASVDFELFKPIQKEFGIWVIRTVDFSENYSATTATVERVDLFDESGRQILPNANWYQVGKKGTASLYISGVQPETITAYYTDIGTEMEQYKKVIGTGKPTWDTNIIELTFDNDMHGHLWFELDLGTHKVQSEIYPITTDNTFSVNYNNSKAYTTKEIDDAIKVIRAEFDTWEGCTLHSITYIGDKENANQRDRIINNMGGGEFDEFIVFTSSFLSPENVEGTAWNPNTEYTDWYWYLGRNINGEWNIITWGY